MQGRGAGAAGAGAGAGAVLVQSRPPHMHAWYNFTILYGHTIHYLQTRVRTRTYTIHGTLHRVYVQI
jgi:hypothetical protein